MHEKNCSKIFIKTLEFTCNNVVSNIKDAYIRYYGEKNRSKIERVFDNLRISFISDNYTRAEIRKQIKGIEEINLIDLNDIDTRKQILKAGMYNLIRIMQNDGCPSVLLYSTDTNNDYAEDYFIEKNCYSSGCCLMDSERPQVYIRMNDDGTFNLHALIHEIGHALMKEELYIFDDTLFYASGVYSDSYNDPKFINELINEYISEEILHMIDKKYKYQMIGINPEFGSVYVALDSLNNDLIKRIYLLLRDEIKDNIINGNCDLIKRIINADTDITFDQIAQLYSVTCNEMKDIGEQIDKPVVEVARLRRKYEREVNKPITDKFYRNVVNGYKKYKEDITRQDKYIDELVSQGKARRI